MIIHIHFELIFIAYPKAFDTILKMRPFCQLFSNWLILIDQKPTDLYIFML